MKRFFLTGIILLMLSCPAPAKETYVSDALKTSLRIAPGSDKKVIRMVKAGEKVTVVETLEFWSKVVLSDGTQGYMMNQALSDEPSKASQIKELQNKFDTLNESYTTLQSQFEKMEKENKSLRAAVATTGKGGPEIEKEYRELKNNASYYLKIKDEYAKLKSELDVKTQEADRLNDVVSEKHIYWFLSGAGVLLFGIFLGYSLKKKRRHSFLD